MIVAPLSLLFKWARFVCLFVVSFVYQFIGCPRVGYNVWFRFCGVWDLAGGTWGNGVCYVEKAGGFGNICCVGIEIVYLILYIFIFTSDFYKYKDGKGARVVNG